MNLETPSHCNGGGEFVDIDHVYIKKGLGGIDLINVCSHGDLEDFQPKTN